MATKQKTIQIVLPDGDPRGVRIAEMTSELARVVEFPRDRLDSFLKVEDSDQVGIYVLVGETEDGEGAVAYIGQTGQFDVRFSGHVKSKAFWNRALVLTSRAKTLSETHGYFLERLAITTAKNCGRVTLSNGTMGNKTHGSAHIAADCEALFETARILFTTLGYHFFEPVSSVTGGHEHFFCTASGINGRAIFTLEDGLVVLKDSVGRLANVPSLVGTSDEKFRQRLIDEGVMRVDGATVVFTKDYPFRSPSTASLALLGRTSNGWVDWKTKDGRTLSELKRDEGGASK